MKVLKHPVKSRCELSGARLNKYDIRRERFVGSDTKFYVKINLKLKISAVRFGCM